MKRLILSFTALLCLLVSTPVYAAYNPLATACGANNGAAQGSTACSSSTTTNPVTNVLKNVSLFLAFVAGIVAVIIIIFSGFQYMTAAGDAQKLSRARSSLIGAIVGLVLIASAETIVIFVISRL